jgi:hypothetical protein
MKKQILVDVCCIKRLAYFSSIELSSCQPLDILTWPLGLLDKIRLLYPWLNQTLPSPPFRSPKVTKTCQ